MMNPGSIDLKFCGHRHIDRPFIEGRRCTSGNEGTKRTATETAAMARRCTCHARPARSGVIEVKRCADVDWSRVQRFRAGVVLRYDGGTFMLGVDAVYGELTDFGGRYEPTDGDIVNTALRELYEESLGLLDITRDQLIGDGRGLVALSCDGAVFLYDTTLKPSIVVQLYRRRRAFATHPEVDRIECFDSSALLQQIDQKRVYARTAPLVRALVEHVTSVASS